MATSADPYALLGVPRGATLAQIKAAHRALAKRYHPDSPTADAKRFLRVQEAYQLLADPLRRREWDARHAPAPVRADQPVARAGRSRRTAPTGAASETTGTPPPRRARTAPPNEQPSRSYTWSASEVPWWEDVARDGRRGSRPRRPAASAPGSAESAARATPGTPGTAETPGANPAAGFDVDEPGAPTSETAAPRQDFDVYSRSSGAAWSSAARAYFRRADADLPRRGSFHRQGSQPLTAARARVAAEEELRRRAAEQPAPPPRRGEARADEPARGHSARLTNASSRRPSGFAAAADPAYAHAGVAHDVEQITNVRQMARERERAAAWPTAGQRVRFALLAWLPLLLLIGYGAPHAAGCAEGTAACPAGLAMLQAAVAAVALVVLIALPRLAFICGVASAGVIVAGATALLGAWLLGVRAPQAASLPAWAILGGATVLVAAYLVAGTWLLTDRRRLPWVGPGRPLR